MELKAMSSSSRAGQRLGLATARRPAKIGRRHQLHRHDLGTCPRTRQGPGEEQAHYGPRLQCGHVSSAVGSRPGRRQSACRNPTTRRFAMTGAATYELPREIPMRLSSALFSSARATTATQRRTRAVSGTPPTSGIHLPVT